MSEEAEASTPPTEEQAAATTTTTPAAAAAAPSLTPSDRDVILGEGSAGHKTNLLLQDMMRLWRILWKLQDGKTVPETPEQAAPIADILYKLITNGKDYELAGLKDVPRPFMKSKGRFLQKQEGDDDSWKQLSEEEAKDALAKAMVAEFKLDDLGNLTQPPYKDLKALMEQPPQVPSPEAAARSDNTDNSPAVAIIFPQAKDAILLPCNEEVYQDKLYETQRGNKTIFALASQLVTSFTNTSDKRVEAALTLLKGLHEAAEVHQEELQQQANNSSGQPSEMQTSKTSRFLVRRTLGGPHGEVQLELLDAAGAAEFAVIFVFEVFLEKEILIPLSSAAAAAAAAAATATATATPADGATTTSGLVDIGAGIANLPMTETVAPSSSPVPDPTDHDVLFGRGGMTNSHLGNRRFRDIIALHRPDYIRAIKMDKPGVARKIVKAIRLGNPPGRFLKKREDGKWYDVGDRTAAEKTSQGLRERSNAEKRQRSALREALRIRKQDMADDSEHGPDAKKSRTSDGGAAGMGDLGAAIPTLNYVGTNLAVPLSLNMKETRVRKKDGAKGGGCDESDLNTEGLPPNAVDEAGNILVTDYDILCGRGGLTNHHKGNKRFRDIVALHRPDYVRAPKIQKPSVARVIVRAIRNGDPPGRFLKKDEELGVWVDIGDKKAAEKTSQGKPLRLQKRTLFVRASLTCLLLFLQLCERRRMKNATS